MNYSFDEIRNRTNHEKLRVTWYEYGKQMKLVSSMADGDKQGMICIAFDGHGSIKITPDIFVEATGNGTTFTIKTKKGSYEIEILDDVSLMLNILRSIEKGREPLAKDFDFPAEEFARIAKICQDDGYITDANFAEGGRGNKPLIAYLSTAKITEEGLEFLEKNA